MMNIKEETGNAQLTHELPKELREIEGKTLILGAGVNGLTTGIYLALLGIPSVIVADEIANTNLRGIKPEIASAYGCASILTRSQNTADIGFRGQASQNIFRHLAACGLFGVRSQQHYELFEKPITEIPAYTQLLHGLNLLPMTGQGDSSTPRLDPTSPIYGWNFDCLFVQPNIYLPLLQLIYTTLGGNFVSHKITPQDLWKLKSASVVNCTGAGTEALFFDPEPSDRVQGFLVYGKAEQMVVNPKTRQVTSYNYTPHSSVYPSDVYFYPYSDGSYVIGGSRTVVSIDPATKQWRGKERLTDFIDIKKYDGQGKVQIPRAIVDLTRKILASATFDHKLPEIEDLSATFGLRFHRRVGPRIEVSEEYGKRIVHNYGQGGAGYTLSWGSACQAVQLVQRDFDSQKIIPPETIERGLANSSLRVHEIRELLLLRQVLLQHFRQCEL